MQFSFQVLSKLAFLFLCSEEDCQKAFADFNGRWYAGRQLSCEFSPVINWKSAICGEFFFKTLRRASIKKYLGRSVEKIASWPFELNINAINFYSGLFAQNRCPRGKNCNFLHVYRNPDDWSEQRSENLRYSRYTRSHEDREKKHYSDRSSDRHRERNGVERCRERESYRYDYKDRRRKHRSKSRDRIDENKPRRKKRRRSRSRSEEPDQEQQSRISAVNTESIKENETCNTRSAESDGDYNMENTRKKSPCESDSDRNQHHRKVKKKHRKHKRRLKNHNSNNDTT